MTTAIATRTTAVTTVGDLLPAVENLAKGCAKKVNTLAQDRAIFCAVDDNSITLGQNGGAHAATVTIPATGTDPGEFAVDAHKLNQALKKLVGRRSKTIDNQEVSLSVEGDKMTFTIGDITMRLSTGEWNPIAEPTDSVVLGTFTADALRSAWNKVSGARGTDDTLPVLTGINMTLSATAAEFATTDRFRLSMLTVDYTPGEAIDEPSRFNHKYLIPGESFKNVADHLRGITGDVTVTMVDNMMLRFSFNQTMIQSRMIDDNFPNIHSLIPTTGTTVGVADRKTLADKVTRLSAMVPKNGCLRVTFTEGELALGVMERSGDEVVATTSMKATTVVDNGVNGDVVAYNITYFLEGLKTLTSDTVAMTMASVSRPTLLFNADEVDEHGTVTTTGEEMAAAANVDLDWTVPYRDHKHLIMPVRLPG